MSLLKTALIAGIPLAATAQQCVDNEDFRDEEGYTCKEWDSWLCERAAMEWSYTFQGQSDLIKNCCATCTENRGKCTDDEDFQDEEGYACKDWRFYDCYKARAKWEYSLGGLTDLLNSCKKTCSSCAYKTEGKCVDDLEYVDEQGWCCGHWQEYNCGKAHSLYGYSTEGEHELRRKCQFSCENCGFEDCEDDKDFTDQDGYRCGDWKGYKCNQAADKWGYSVQAQRDLIEACPFTCGSCDSAEDDGEDDESEEPEEERPVVPAPPTEGERLTFSAYLEFCNERTDKQSCTDIGCKFKEKRGVTSCFQKKAKMVKCKKIKDFPTCLAVGCQVNDKMKCNGKTNFA